MSNETSDKSSNDKMSNWIILVPMVLIGIIIIVGVILLNVSDTKTNPYPKSSEVLPKKIECYTDSTSITSEVWNRLLDLQNSGSNSNNTITYSKKDENGVWFDNELNKTIRIVYKAEDKILLVYFGDNLYKKYINVIVTNQQFKHYPCISGNYSYPGYVSFSTKEIKNQQEVIVRVSEDYRKSRIGVSYFPNNSTRYNFDANSLGSSLFDNIK